MVVAFVQATLKHSNAETYAWMAVIAAPWLVAISVAGRRVKCPLSEGSVQGTGVQHQYAVDITA
jgi:hypothetical protein